MTQGRGVKLAYLPARNISTWCPNCNVAFCLSYSYCISVYSEPDLNLRHQQISKPVVQTSCANADTTVKRLISPWIKWPRVPSSVLKHTTHKHEHTCVIVFHLLTVQCLYCFISVLHLWSGFWGAIQHFEAVFHLNMCDHRPSYPSSPKIPWTVHVTKWHFGITGFAAWEMCHA